MSTNRSVLRTKKAIRQGFIELLSEKQSIEKITIIELTDRANIVRSTFIAIMMIFMQLLRKFKMKFLMHLRKQWFVMLKKEMI